MKQTKLVSVVLIALVVLSWLAALTTTLEGGGGEYKTHIEMAEEYVNRKLYQKAIEEYDAALAIKSTSEIWDAKLSAYKNAYAANEDLYDEYVAAAKNAVTQFGKNAEYAIVLAELYAEKEDYVQGYKVLQQAAERGIEDEKADQLRLELQYSYRLDWKTYEAYRPFVNGFYAVKESGLWKYINASGEDAKIENLELAGPVSSDGIRVVINKQGGCLIDTQQVMQGVLNFAPKDAGVYSENLVAIQNGEKYGYYNLLGDKQFGEYQDAGSFINGHAAVKTADKWYLIDTKGNQVSDEYEDIVLNADGTYLKDEVMLAKKDGIYKFYKKDTPYGDGYTDADIITDDQLIAVCKDNKWGYVNLSGEQVIAPLYEKAKSFSNGLAAVFNGEKWGFIDKNGNLVIDYLFDDADYFNDKKGCMVAFGKTWQLILLYNK